MSNSFLSSAIKQFEYYKLLGEKTIAQISEDSLFWKYNEDSNSITIIVQHLSGNMLSRWTDFLTTDGEKEWRKRDDEFENIISSKEELLNTWNAGWACLFDALSKLQTTNLETIVYIRNQGQTVTEAINRQLCHYAYHVGQIVFIGKMIALNNWQSLSIPKGNSQAYNQQKFEQPKQQVHFTEEYLKKS